MSAGCLKFTDGEFCGEPVLGPWLKRTCYDHAHVCVDCGEPTEYDEIRCPVHLGEVTNKRESGDSSMMESAEQTTTTDDPFANQEASTDDPFAGEQREPMPVVDKEGREIGQQPPEGAAPAPEPQPPAPAPEPQASANGQQAPAEAATGSKSPLRQYRLLYQTGPKTWEEHEWMDEGAQVPTRILEARNNEHVIRQAFDLLGQPDGGVTVLPVPESSFKPKRLQRKPVVPRTALDITDAY